MLRNFNLTYALPFKFAHNYAALSLQQYQMSNYSINKGRIHQHENRFSFQTFEILNVQMNGIALVQWIAGVNFKVYIY